MTEQETRQRVLDLIATQSPRPTELLEMVEGVPYSEVQDVMAELLDAGQIELASDRRLRTKKSAA